MFNDSDDLACYVCFTSTRVCLDELVWVAGHGWLVEDAFEVAKQEAGLDEYEVRVWTGWYRHIILALLAHAFLVVRRQCSARAAAVSHAWSSSGK